MTDFEKAVCCVLHAICGLQVDLGVHGGQPCARLKPDAKAVKWSQLREIAMAGMRPAPEREEHCMESVRKVAQWCVLRGYLHETRDDGYEITPAGVMEFVRLWAVRLEEMERN
jgi:hypothetical protein